MDQTPTREDGKDRLDQRSLRRQTSYTHFVQQLTDDGVDVLFIISEASYQTIHSRLPARGGEEDSAGA